ncbi:MAG: SDR family oxidoreductase [Ignavibacteria bacterium]|nr:SDR family oxidoreductase [Ignavibacteria bacterium]
MSRNNKVALVTGGARRLGKDICLDLGKSGFDIILNYNNTAKDVLDKSVKEISDTGARVTAIKCDVSKVTEIKSMFETIASKFENLDLLVNNAAVFEQTNFLETNEDVFDKHMDTNLKSTFFCSQEAAKIMLKSENKTGRIINIASLGAIENWTGFIPYSLSKTGVIKLTALLAKKLAPNILVNAIAPGTILIENDENQTVNTAEIKKYPMKRFAKSGDLTSLIIYLANENNYITGQTFTVDGGRSL